MIYALFICLLCFLALVGSSFAIGKLILKSENSTAGALAIGGVLVPTLYALIITQGNTQMIGVLLITILLFVFGSNKVSKQPIPWKSLLTWTGIAFILPIALHFGSLFDGHTWFLHLDHSYYAQAGDFLNFSGTESPLINYTYPEKAAEIPYHYLDLWQIALFEDVTQLPPIFVLQHVVQPFWILVLLLAVKEHLIKHVQWQWWHGLLVVSALFVTVWSFTFPRFVSSLESLSVFQHTPLNYPKLLPIYALLACGFLFYKSNRVLFAWMMVAAAITNTVVMPALFVTIGSLMFFEVVRERKIKKDQWIPVAFMVVYAAFFYLFYFKLNAVTEDSEQYASSSSSQTGYLKTAINSFGVTIIQAATTSIGYLIILLPLFSKQLLALYKKAPYYLWTVVLLTLFGAGAYGALHPTHASIQLWSCIALPATNLLWLAIIIALMLQDQPMYKKGILAGLLVFNVGLNLPAPSQHDWTVADHQKTMELLDGDTQLRCAFFKAPEEFNDAHSLNTLFDKPGEILNYCGNQISIPCLTILDIPTEQIEDSDTYSNYTEEVLTAVPFYQFFEAGGYGESQVQEAQTAFIDTFGVKYLVCTPKAELPTVILDKTKESIALSNGERIYKL